LEFDKGKHSTSRTLRELISIINDHFESPVIKFSTNLVSIIVPVLDEVRTISTVLDSLISLKKNSKLYSYEIICVDGGSNDGTKEILEKYKTQVAIINSSEFGKGICVREGLKKAHGDLIVLFPGDLEYSTKDIEKILQSLKSQEFGMSIGTRAYDSKDLNNRLISIYNKKSLTYYLSKYGGLMISLVFLLKYQRIVSDPLSSVKAFNIRVIRDMKFKSTGFDFDIELISELFKTKNVLLEVPVSYNARSVDQGKKMVAKEGLSCLMRVLFH
jgi:glycosyltransferase involved in cell wall biosynthesis